MRDPRKSQLLLPIQCLLLRVLCLHEPAAASVASSSVCSGSDEGEEMPHGQCLGAAALNGQVAQERVRPVTQSLLQHNYGSGKDRGEQALIEKLALVGDGDEEHRPCWCAAKRDSVIPLAGVQREPSAIYMYEMATLQHTYYKDKRKPGFKDISKVVGESLCAYCNATETVLDWESAPVSGIVNGGTQLFGDSYLIASSSGLRRRLTGAVEHLKTTLPCSGNSCTFSGNVIHNGTHFLSYYSEASRLDGSKPLLKVASSDDGINWQEDKITGLDNVNTSADDWCVLHDDAEAAPRFRYKLAFQCSSGDAPAASLCFATSADGVHWVDHGKKATGLPLSDRRPCLQTGGSDTSILSLVAAAKFPAVHGRPGEAAAVHGILTATVNRSVFTQALDNPLMSISFDTSKWLFSRFSGLESYRRQALDISQTWHAGAYQAIVHLHEFPWLKDGCPGTRTECNEDMWKFFEQHVGKNRTDSVQPYLITSRDGVHYNFQWVYAPQPLDMGQRPNDKTILHSSGLLTAYGSHYVFFTQNAEKYARHSRREDEFVMSRFPENRISGLETAPLGQFKPRGELLTRPIEMPPGTDAIAVSFNVDIPEGSTFAVDLMQPHGTHSHSASSESKELGSWIGPLDGPDVARCTVELSSGTAAQGSVPVQLRLRLEGETRLYAMHVRSDDPVLVT